MNEEEKKARKFLADVVKLCKKYGVQVTPGDMDIWIKKYDNFETWLDGEDSATGSLWVEQINPDFFGKCADYIKSGWYER